MLDYMHSTSTYLLMIWSVTLGTALTLAVVCTDGYQSTTFDILQYASVCSDVALYHLMLFAEVVVYQQQQ
jgi:hypothetical protein